MDIRVVLLFFVYLTGCLGNNDTEAEEITPIRLDAGTLDFILEEDVKNVRFISNGSVASPDSHPHMVALTVGPITAVYCGGSLITTRTVLTAAHCIDVVYIDGELVSSLRVKVGSNRWDSGGKNYRIERNVTHPLFYRPTLRNDIGLLITAKEVALSREVKVVPLSYDVIPGGVRARVAGWGKLGTRKPASDVLQELFVPTISPEECTDRYNTFSSLYNVTVPILEPPIEICTYYSKGSGFCKGDSGSALTRLSDGSQIGVVSWGILCARGAPDVYARISGFKDWLQENIV